MNSTHNGTEDLRAIRMPHLFTVQGKLVLSRVMTRAFLGILALTSICLLVSCGGGSTPLSLSVQPATSDIFTSFEDGTYTSAVLTATLSNGTVPANIQWKTSNACIAPGDFLNNTATVVCNFTCGGMGTATIRATAQGLSGTATVNCTWR